MRGLKSALATGAAAMALASGAQAQAEDTAPSGTAARIGNADDIVVTATKVNRETPITSSVDTFEPQSIVSRTIIANSVPPTADISDVVLLTPGASGTSNGNGPGLSESKTVLRGFQDGQYNITYDGIPFGDSNDPTHHSTAYFPTGTYERIIVDRGPGSATDLGQASYGGNVHIVSRALADEPGLEAQGVYGSYNTWLARGTAQTGSIERLGGLRLIGVGEYKKTDGALTGSKAKFYNLFGKLELPLGTDAKFSLLSSYNNDFYNQSDNNGITCGVADPASVGGNYAQGHASQSSCAPTSQVGLYGTNYGLVDFRDPRFTGTPFTSARYEFNWTRKQTDFEIARLQVKLTPTLSIDSKMYTYAYKNFTFSSANSITPCTGAPSQTTCGGMSTKVPTPGGTVSASGNLPTTKLPGDIPGYTKLNQYRQWGNVTQVDWASPIGIARVGVWYESSSSHRYRYNYDQSRAFTAGAFGDGFFDFAAMANFYNYSQTNTAANVQLNGQPVPQYIAYDEHTGWEQVQAFGEYELKFLDDRLTVTPGIKVGRFQRTINTPIAAQSSRVGITTANTYKPTLPYATVNFKVRPNWSVYAQFAKGFLIPSLSSSLEQSGLNPAAPLTPQPTKTTNYQAGTVFAGERLNVDVDIYHIELSNTTTCDPSLNVCTQSGVSSTYEGVEGGISYLALPGLTLIANGSLATARVDTDLKQWVPQAPDYTALLGVVYRGPRFKLSYLHKFTGRQFADTQTGFLNPTTLNGSPVPGGGIANQVRIAPYSNGILAGSVTVGPIEIGAAVYDLFDDKSVTKIGGSGNFATAQYFFQAGRSYQAQVTARF